MKFKKKEKISDENVIELRLEENGDEVNLIGTDWEGYERIIMSFEEEGFKRYDILESYVGDALQLNEAGKIEETE